MNERIQRLVEQATVATDQELHRLSQGIEGMPSRLDLFNQKFAQLIVQECVSIVQPYMSRWEEDHDLTKRIKEHFGVE
jgi:signal transduction protein with GAF and PtsI domain